MKNKNIYIGIAVTILAVAGLIFWGLRQPVNAPSTNMPTPGTEVILFYGKECPHCKDVEKFLANNNIPEKIKFESVEVWHNAANADLMKQKAGECKIDPSGMGVPFLWARGKCYVGTPEVESFFKQEAGIQ